MRQVKFSHRYYKLDTVDMGFAGYTVYEAILLHVFVEDASNFHASFIEYDTFHPNGKYPLPSKGKMLVLLLKDVDCNHLFTTIRRQTDQKEEYYKGLIGQTLKIEITEGNK